MFKRLILKIFAFYAFAALLISCRGEENDYALSDSPVEVHVVKVEDKLLDDNLNSFGTVSYKSKTDLTVQVAGTITGFTAKEGKIVRKGQVLAVLKNIQLEIQKKQTESSLKSAESSLKLSETELAQEILNVESRMISIQKAELNIKQKQDELELQKKNLEAQEALNKIGGVTDSSIEQLKMGLSSQTTEIEILKKELEMSTLGLRNEDLINSGIVPSEDEAVRKRQLIELNTKSKIAQIEQAKASVENMRQQLLSVNTMMDELVIKAPVDGIIAQNYYENGEYIEANQKFTTLIDTTSVYALIYIQEQDMVNFTAGTPIFVTIPSITKSFSSVISEISPIADSSSGNFRVKAELDNVGGEIKPGMFVKCSIQRKSAELYPAIPESCLISSSENAAKIFTVMNGFAVKKDVTVSGRKDGFVWIRDSLKSGDVVIDNPSPFLKEGQKVSF